jgi:hypothetical protein
MRTYTRAYYPPFLFITSAWKKKGESKKPQVVLPRWSAPPNGVLKINVDAAVGKTHNMGAIAAVVRDEGGVFRGAHSVKEALPWAYKTP